MAKKFAKPKRNQPKPVDVAKLGEGSVVQNLKSSNLARVTQRSPDGVYYRLLTGDVESDERGPTRELTADSAANWILVKLKRPKKGAATKSRKPKPRKAKSQSNPDPKKAPLRFGAKDAAVVVLKDQPIGLSGDRALTAEEMMQKILERGLWSTKGATPAATLYAAIIREIANKGPAARFKRSPHRPAAFELA